MSEILGELRFLLKPLSSSGIWVASKVRCGAQNKDKVFPQIKYKFEGQLFSWLVKSEIASCDGYKSPN